MSIKAKRPCSIPGCPELTDGHNSRCSQHQQQSQHQHKPKTNITSNQKGYTYRWQIYTKWYKNHNPLCRVCKEKNPSVLTPTKDVDHIIPVTGPDDPLFWVYSNHQPLCHSCHSKKTAQERRVRCKG